MHRITLPTVITAAVLVTGCAAPVAYTATVSSDGYYGPDLVYVAPGVQVIADYNEPIFYSDNFYWRFDGVTWYRSGSYTGGWVYATPARPLLQIDQPRAYVHYRPRGWVARRDRGREGAIVRDHREDRPRAAPPPSRAAPPASQHRHAPPPQERKDVRDHREHRE
jgi:hypothetical protein